MFDGAGNARNCIHGLLHERAFAHHIERLGGPGETRAKQEAGDYGEKDMFDFHRRRALPIS
jgi:hypothetical protein